jgi:hypothetical protein
VSGYPAISFPVIMLTTAILVLLALSSGILAWVEVRGTSPVCSPVQPTVNAPRISPWKALSEAESAGVNDLLQRKFDLTGNSGSRYVLSALQ